MTEWVKHTTLVCPECRYVFGKRTAAGSIEVLLPGGDPPDCRHKGDASTKKTRCPHVQEAMTESERSDRTAC